MTSKKTIQFDFSPSKLAHVKSRIDEINSVISKSNFIQPLIGVRKTLFYDSILNTENVKNIISRFHPSSELPPLPVTNPPTLSHQTKQSPIVARERAKLGGMTAAKIHEKKKREIRENRHKNCFPVLIPKTPPVIRVKEMSSTSLFVPIRRPEHSDDGLIRNDVTDIIIQSETIANDVIQVTQKSTSLLPESPHSTGISELEKLIAETHELLKSEGLIQYPSSTISDDLLAELENDLSQLTSVDHEKNLNLLKMK